MSDNLLRNGNFSDGWHENTPDNGNQTPKGWELFYHYPGNNAELTKFEPRPAGDTEDVVFRVPECVHKLNNQLPENQRLGGSDALILDGDACFKIFSAGGAIIACLYQELVVEPYARIKATFNVRTHGHKNADEGAAYWRVGVDDENSQWLTFKRDFEDEKYYTVEIVTRADRYGDVTVWWEGESHSQAAVDFFFSAWRVELIDDPDQEPEPCECRGLPRVDYKRVYNAIYPGTDPDMVHDIVDLVWPQTVGESTDDACIGDLTDKTAVLWEYPQAMQQVMLDWRDEFYPGTAVIFKSMSNTGGPAPIDPPVTPKPDPPTGRAKDGGPQYTLPSHNLIGLHMQDPKKDWPTYVQKARPTITKTVGQLGMIVEAKQAFPDTLTVYREILDDGMFKWADKKAAARQALDIYSGHLEAHARETGHSMYWMTEQVDVIESVNEVCTVDQVVDAAVEFDIEFCHAVHERYGDALHAGILTVPIGNPQPYMIKNLLPAAIVAEQYNDYLAPHPYWSADRNQSYILSNWEHHAGRWMQWDKVFVENGVYPKYYGGEAGIVYVADGNPDNFNSGKGWKSCGPFSNYIKDMKTFRELCQAWNYEHGNRFIGAVIFCYGVADGGWANFDFEPGDLYEMTEALK